MSVKYKMEVRGMSCDHCTTKVKNALAKEGIKSVDVSLSRAEANILANTLDKELEGRAKKAIESLGYSVGAITTEAS